MRGTFVVVAAVVGVQLAFAGAARAEGTPVSAAAPPQYATTTFDIPYTASDDGGPGLDHVDLYVKGPNDVDWRPQPVANDTTPDDTQSFSYMADQGDGSYAFYTVAVDKTPITPISELPNLLGDG
jgi:hypothetical protein